MSSYKIHHMTSGITCQISFLLINLYLENASQVFSWVMVRLTVKLFPQIRVFDILDIH